jgi:phosphoglycolate phosphatase
VVSDYKIKKGLMVGDRSSDIHAGIKQRLYTVGCTYGYGEKNELNDAQKVIEDITKLSEVILQLENLVVSEVN